MQNHIKKEEVTLEPTPLLKHTYTTINKSTLSQKQCKFSFQKFMIKAIKTYTSQYNKNMVHNLSDHTTKNEFSVLSKGLFLVRNPTKTFKQEINKSCNKLKTRILKVFFCNSIHDKPPLLREDQTGYPLPLTTLPYSTFSHALDKNSPPSTLHVGRLTLI